MKPALSRSPQTPQVAGAALSSPATIYRPARSAMTSGKANTRRCSVSSRARPLSSPPLGWTGGTDTLSQLDFPSAEAAVAYAKRQGFNFIVQGPAEASCGAERVGERHCHRRSGDRSAHETRRVGGKDQFPTRGVGSGLSPWVLSFSAQTTARWAHAGIGLIVAVAGRGCGSFIGHGSGSAPNVKDFAMRMRAIRRGPASRSFLRCNAVGPRAGTPLAIRRDY